MLSKGTAIAPTITLDKYQLDVIHQFTYPGSTMKDNLLLEEAELNKRTEKTISTHSLHKSGVVEHQTDNWNKESSV